METKDEKELSEDEKDALFVTEYRELCEKHKRKMDALPLDTPQAIVIQKLHVVRF